MIIIYINFKDKLDKSHNLVILLIILFFRYLNAPFTQLYRTTQSPDFIANYFMIDGKNSKFKGN